MTATGARPQLSEDEIDDLMYLSRTGDVAEFKTFQDELCAREKCTLSDLLADTKDEFTGSGPLHMAAANGHTDMLKHLLSALSSQTEAQLALLNAQNGAGNTALHYAALNGHLPAVQALVDGGADPTVTNKAGHDAVYEAELNDKTEVVEWVLRESEGLEKGIAGDEEDDDDDGDAGVAEGVENLKVEEGDEDKS